ncbi:MAG: tyrosine recombinase XerC [Microgenomates bacterium 39_6]|nr:MAG: tyrosine recombinase XerC [Microgenomates bacterium 39_6]
MNLPLFDDYLLFLKTNKYSTETIYNYERDLTVFAEFLSSSLSIDFNQVSKKTIDQYKAYLVSRDRKTPIKDEKGAELSAQSINRMLSTLRSYLKYLLDLDEPIPIPPEAVKLVRTERKHPRVAELEELVRLIESPQSLEEDPLVGLRNRAILEILFSTGMRISELVNLDKADIDKTGRIFIMGKGKKERFVYLTPRAKNILERYLVTRNDDFPALFIPYSGPNVNNKDKRLSTNYIQGKIKKYREKLKINVPVSAHSLRHGFATYLAESGASPAAIQILLGHESLDTTTRYVHASDHFAEETHRKFHPLKDKKSLS